MCKSWQNPGVSSLDAVTNVLDETKPAPWLCKSCEGACVVVDLVSHFASRPYSKLAGKSEEEGLGIDLNAYIQKCPRLSSM
jgi:hypothetical protein